MIRVSLGKGGRIKFDRIDRLNVEDVLRVVGVAAAHSDALN